MPRGYDTVHSPEIPLAREDIAVHPAARQVFDYFLRFVGNSHVAPGLPQIAPPILEFICEDEENGSKKQPNIEPKSEKDDEEKKNKNYMDNRLLVGGFHQLALLPRVGKLDCLVVDRDIRSHADIEQYAWQQVQLCDPMVIVDNKAMAAKFHELQHHFPEALVSPQFANDPGSSQSLPLSTESLCRMYQVRSNSIRRHMPEVRRGGIETHSYTDLLPKKDDEK